MKKTDSFFIRVALPLNATGTGAGDFLQVPIDLGAYVDALGKAVLRIHNIAVQYSDASGGTPDLAASSPASCDWQLTTQSQTGIVVVGDNKSVVASARLIAYNVDTAAGVPSYVSDNFDVAPQHWTQGYLIGVESMYLSGATTTTGWNDDITVSLIMECTSETLTQAAAMALALSQQ
jgi:hypothetical protein